MDYQKMEPSPYSFEEELAHRRGGPWKAAVARHYWYWLAFWWFWCSSYLHRKSTWVQKPQAGRALQPCPQHQQIQRPHLPPPGPIDPRRERDLPGPLIGR